jgi:hypothetical protein
MTKIAAKAAPHVRGIRHFIDLNNELSQLKASHIAMKILSNSDFSIFSTIITLYSGVLIFLIST